MDRTSPQTILITLNPLHVPTDQLQRIQSLAPKAQIIVTDQREELEPLMEQVDVLAGSVPPDWLPRAHHLRWYQQWGAGADWLMRHPEAIQMDFILTNASGVHSIPISEHILALMLAFARRLPQAIRAQAQGEWRGPLFGADSGLNNGSLGAFELAGKTMLLLGVGAIGQRTARVARALGMRVIGVRKNPGQREPNVDVSAGTDELADYLPEADFLVLTLPLTPETRGIINAEVLAQMKRTAYLINIGRGGTVDEPALVAALQSGQIAGAGLDVFATEPLPPDSPLWSMPNVIITPHSSGETPHYDERALEIFVENLERYVNGKTLKNLVDKEQGY